ncbi:hypothetical protein [Sphingomonas koreensis]|uniref:hypothetical protein n=1 Tax=Sphingomonas koreensis TaxID=93064 RepID=UPI000CBD41BF|nr:hypothetical protein [Sphingomonas koreensis]PJI87959.1 hypothetical protein BDW16_1220 [Sphingomonas koreensis]
MTILVNETLETVSAMVPCVMPAACAQRASIVAADVNGGRISGQHGGVKAGH